MAQHVEATSKNDDKRTKKENTLSLLLLQLIGAAIVLDSKKHDNDTEEPMGMHWG